METVRKMLPAQAGESERANADLAAARNQNRQLQDQLDALGAEHVRKINELIAARADAAALRRHVEELRAALAARACGKEDAS